MSIYQARFIRYLHNRAACVATERELAGVVLTWATASATSPRPWARSSLAGARDSWTT
jgi:hypothetical protein